MSSFTKTFPAFLAAFILTTLALTSTHAANFEITNQCPYTVWGAATNGGRRLDPGETWSLDTGDCAGLLECNPFVSGRPPLTLAEFSLNGGGNNDYYDISVIDGFNVPMSFNPTNGDCPQLTCRDPNCPDAYQFPTNDTKTKACPAGTNYKIVFCP
ncbi:hypothetical protein ACS0TY_017823 [Phlomoides rotata]